MLLQDLATVHLLKREIFANEVVLVVGKTFFNGEGLLGVFMLGLMDCMIS